MRNIKTEREDSYGEDENDADKENEERRENYCYTCNRQFDNRNGYSVHMSKAHGGANRNNSNNVASENEPPSKRQKTDGKIFIYCTQCKCRKRKTYAFVLPTRNGADSSASIFCSGFLPKHMQLWMQLAIANKQGLYPLFG